MEQQHPIGTSSVGNKGYPRITGAPTVSPIALGAMKSNQRSYNFNFSKLTSKAEYILPLSNGMVAHVL